MQWMPISEEWITREEWNFLLSRSYSIGCEIDRRKRRGEPTASLWQEVRPIRHRIRSPHVKVIGIDDRKTLRPQDTPNGH